MEVILVLLIAAILNGAAAFIDEMLSDMVPMTLHADQYMIGAGGGSMVDGRRPGQRAGVPCDPVYQGGCRGRVLPSVVRVDG